MKIWPLLSKLAQTNRWLCFLIEWSQCLTANSSGQNATSPFDFGVNIVLKDKIAVVTGAGNTDGIGYAAAKAFIKNGAKVILVDLREDDLKRASDALGGNATGIVADVRSVETSKSVFEFVQQEYGRLDILVNSAGITQSRTTVNITADD